VNFQIVLKAVRGSNACMLKEEKRVHSRLVRGESTVGLEQKVSSDFSEGRRIPKEKGKVSKKSPV